MSLSIVRVFPRRCGHRWRDGHQFTCKDPRALARGEARCQQPVIDFPCDRETVKHCWRQEQPGVVLKAIRCRVDVSHYCCDDAVTVWVHARDFGHIGIKQPFLKVSDVRLEGRPPFVDIEVNLIRETAWDTPLTEFAL